MPVLHKNFAFFLFLLFVIVSLVIATLFISSTISLSEEKVEDDARASTDLIDIAHPSERVTESGKTITVSRDASVKSIKTALQLAHDFDQIIIKPGIYSERNIIIDKKVVIKGDGYPVIDGEGKGEIFRVTIDDVTISGLTIKNSGISYLEENAGIRLNGVKNCVVSNNRFIDNFFAIYVAKSSDSIIEDNQIEGVKKRETNSGNGIHLWNSSNITIKKNSISDHRDGIYFEFVTDSKVLNNLSANNLRYGLHFMFSDNCEYKENVFDNNGTGVAVMYTKNVLMEKNEFRLNWGAASYGLLLKEISDSRILNNEFEENTTGAYLEGSNRLTIEQNNFVKNGWAIRLMANSMDNFFHDNNFIANSFDVSTNSRQSFNTFEGNYWANYSGYDLDKNGFGDVPYRPVTEFSILVERHPASLILLNSLFIKVLDVAESIIPALTPEALTDPKPRMSMLND